MRLALFILGMGAAADAQEPLEGFHLVQAVDERWILQHSGRPDTLSRTMMVQPMIAASSSMGRQPFRFTMQMSMTIEQFIDRYFDYYAAKFPSTTREIAVWIAKVNGLASPLLEKGRTIIVPPIPVKAREEWGYENNVRAFNPETFGYDVARDLEDLEVRGVSRLRAAADMATERRTNVTLTSLPIELASAEVLRQGERKPGPARIFWLSRKGEIKPADLNVELLDSADTSALRDCDDSPYEPAWRERAKSFNREALIEKAKALPFVIVDWDFTAGHGKKVEGVARATLACIGFEFLPIQTFDLDPARNRNGIAALVAERSAALTPALGQQVVNYATEWLDATSARNEDETTLNQLVVDALLWKFLFRQPSWINASFRIKGLALLPTFHDYLGDSSGFVVAAAGNEPAPLSPAYFPQMGAATYPGRFLNVTFGKRDGQVLGTFTSSGVYSVEVGAMTRGGGFEYPGYIASSDLGSSFAAPAVAIASWVKALVDDAPNASMRALLMDASIPAEPALGRVGSGGYFDALRLLAGVGNMHYLSGSQAPIPLASVEGSLEIRKADDALERILLRSDARASRTVSIRKQGDHFQVWIRGQGKTIARGMLTDLDCRLTLKTGQVLSLSEDRLDGEIELSY